MSPVCPLRAWKLPLLASVAFFILPFSVGGGEQPLAERRAVVSLYFVRFARSWFTASSSTTVFAERWRSPPFTNQGGSVDFSRCWCALGANIRVNKLLAWVQLRFPRRAPQPLFLERRPERQARRHFRLVRWALSGFQPDSSSLRRGNGFC